MSDKKEIFVLGDGIGSITLEDFCGEDDSVVRAARVSHGKTVTEAERDKKLIYFMLLNHHGTPFEHNFFKFRVKAPIFVFRQWHRTRIGVSYNEISARYAEMKEEFFIPKLWRAQDKKNKQGSVAADLDHGACEAELLTASKNAFITYKRLIERGVAREMARMALPVNLYSEMYFSCNARSLMNFIELRSDTHAQFETQLYSDAMAQVFKEKMPWTYEAFASRLDPERYPGLKLEVPA